jgi:single-strand DNA-binding protein
MSVTITIKLNKAASQFQAGESTGFGIRGGVRYYDRETKQKEWTNYECVVFAKIPEQISFYQQALVEGSVIEITGKDQKIKQFQGNSGLSLSIEILNASLGYVGAVGQAPIASTQGFKQTPQQMPQQRPQQAPQQFAPGFDDDIGF